MRHFPAINWLNSYSLYREDGRILHTNVDPNFCDQNSRWRCFRESSLQEIVRLVGRDTLSESDQLKLEVARSLREDFLQQNTFHDVDTFCSLDKQNKMLSMILLFYHEAQKALEEGVYLGEIENLPVRERIARSKYLSEEEEGALDDISRDIRESIAGLIAQRRT